MTRLVSGYLQSWRVRIFPVWRADNNRMKGNNHCNIFTRQRLNNNYYKRAEKLTHICWKDTMLRDSLRPFNRYDFYKYVGNFREMLCPKLNRTNSPSFLSGKMSYTASYLLSHTFTVSMSKMMNHSGRILFVKRIFKLNFVFSTS